MLPALSKLKELVPAGGRVLDLGCNCGYETKRLKELGFEAVGVDFSEKSIEVAKRKNPDMLFVSDNMLNDLTYLGKFFAVVAIASIIHISEKDLELCFQRIYDILEDDGYLFMVVRAETGKLEASYKEINDDKYDREVYGYSKELLESKMNDKFQFAFEGKTHDKHWKHYFYKKN